MTSKIYLIVIAVCALLGWAGLWVVLTGLEPYSVTAQVAIAAFYLSAGVALAGTFTLINYFLRFGQGVGLFALLRQGVILALLILAFLHLQHLQILTWWDGALLIAIALLIEFLFAARDDRSR